MRFLRGFLCDIWNRWGEEVFDDTLSALALRPIHYILCNRFPLSPDEQVEDEHRVAPQNPAPLILHWLRWVMTATKTQYRMFKVMESSSFLVATPSGLSQAASLNNMATRHLCLFPEQPQPLRVTGGTHSGYSMRILGDAGNSIFYTLTGPGVTLGVEVSMPPGEDLAVLLPRVRLYRHLICR